jgi:predicted phage terminase large subunit-like protein
MLSRLEGNWKVIIIMTRWAERDLAGRIIETFGDLVEVIKYKAVQEDGSMLCDDILSKQDFEIKITEMNEDIVQANYNQEPIDVKGRLYGEFKTYDKLPEIKQIYSYTDTADKGEDFLVTIVYGIINNEVYVIDIQYDDRSMEITEEEAVDILYNNDVNIADVESNNGGRGWARNVERRLKEKYNSNKTVIRPFTQTGNKEARILASATWVTEHFYMPFNWKNKYREAYKSISTYQKKGKNKHDDIQDVMAGIYERVANKPRLEFGYRNII